MHLLTQILNYLFSMMPLVSQSSTTQIEKSYFNETRNRNIPVTLWLSSEDKAQPLIIYSHGWNRVDSHEARYRKGWIREILLNNGYNVCSIEHKDDNVHLLGRRAEDIAFIIDQLSRSALLGRYVESAPIGIMGFSKGGATCISAIGGKLRELNVDEDEFTKDLGQEHIDKINRYHENRDFSISRVKAAVLLQPGWLRRFDQESLAKVAVPVLALDKINEESVEVCFKKWMSSNENVKKIDLPGQSHFVLLDEPTEFDKRDLPNDLYFTLFEEGMEGVDRKEVHHTSADEIVSFFDKHLKS